MQQEKKKCKLLILKLGAGSLEEGFKKVIIQLWHDRKGMPEQYCGCLPPIFGLEIAYDNWREHYLAYYEQLNWPHSSNRIEFVESDVPNVSRQSLELKSFIFIHLFREWLNSRELWKTTQEIYQSLYIHDEIQVIIETDDIFIRKLPWHVWELVQNFKYAEVGLSLSRWSNISQKNTVSDSVRILAVFGNDYGLDLKQDEAIISSLPNSEVSIIKEPSKREFNELLWDERGWDILFYAGHSSSDSYPAHLRINAYDELTIEQFKFALKTAIKNGLRLAILNSCDGLGLAKQLEELELPQVIVMREPIYDDYAHEFLLYFLDIYSNNHNLYTAMRMTREKLQALESQYPFANMLPIICQNPVVAPPTWQDLRFGKNINVINLSQIGDLNFCNQINTTDSNLFEIFKIRWLSSAGGKLKGIKNNSEKWYPLAFLENLNTSQKKCRLLNACALSFRVEAMQHVGWVIVENISVTVNSYEKIPVSNVRVACGMSQANVYFVEIDDPSDSNRNIFNAEYVYPKCESLTPGIMHLENGKPELFVLRINAKTPGFYNFDVHFTASHKEMEQTIKIFESYECIFLDQDHYHGFVI